MTEIASSQKKKICTPALLFCRSSSRSPSYIDSRRSQSKSSSRKYPICKNHPNKKGHFTTQTNLDSFFYCERCAILLASQGFNVHKIAMDESRSNMYVVEGREKQVEEFLNKIKSFSRDIDERKTIVKDRLIGSEQFYGSQIEQINQYFKIVYQSLELQKNNQRMHAEEQLRITYNQLQGLKQQIDQITDDIEENVDAVYQIQEQSYRPVIMQYEDKLLQFQIKFQQMNPKQPIKKKLINNLPQSILSLSEIILKNNSGLISENVKYDQDIGVQQNQNNNNSLVFSFQGAEHIKTVNSSQTIQNYLEILADS